MTNVRPTSPSNRWEGKIVPSSILSAHFGFTLIETIITLLVIGILFAIAAPSYLRWANNKRVDDALTQVVGAFKEAQSEALRKGKGCTVTIEPQRISAQTASGANCLPTGKRDFTTSNPNLQLDTSFNSTDPLRFTYKKTTPEGGIVVLSQTDTSRRRCVVVSEGIGIIRTGYYQGDPSSPVEADCHRNP